MAAEIPVLAPADVEVAPGGRSKRRLLIIFIAAGVVLLGGAAAAVWWLQAGSHPDAAAPKPAAQAPALYLALDPPFVVNFDSGQAVRFLQITVQLMSRDPATLELLKSNDPVVRNDLLLLFGNQKYSVLATREGKESLRADALTAVRRVIGAAGGHPEKVEAVYFTSFVMQ